MGHWDGGASFHLVHVMFRPFSYCHAPSNLGNQQLEQGRISVIGSFFGKNVFFFHNPLFAGIHLMNTWLFSPSLLSTSTAARVVLDFILVFSKAIIAAWLSQFMTTFLFLISANTSWVLGCCSFHCKTSA